MDDQGGNRFIVGVMVGAVLGGVVGAAAMGGAGYNIYNKRVAEIRRGWSLVPVIVLAEDVRAGELVVFDKVAQRSVPVEFVTESVVMPNEASDAVNQRATVPLKKGDLLLWSSLTTGSEADVAACSLPAPIRRWRR